MARYPNGRPVRVLVTVQDLGGSLAADASLALTLSLPDGTTAPYDSPTADGSAGYFHQDIPATDLTQNGHYQYAWTGDATVVRDPAAGDFDVYDPFEVRVISRADAKDMLNIPQDDTAADEELDGWIGAIESGLERFTGGPVITRSVTERAELDGNYTTLLLRQRPLVAVQSVVSVASGTALDISAGLDIDANAGVVRTKLGWPFLGPYFAFRPAMLVTYTAGWGESVPAAFSAFARIVIKHMWETQRGPLAMPMAGDVAMAVPGFGFAIPARAAELLNGSQDGVPFACEAYL